MKRQLSFFFLRFAFVFVAAFGVQPMQAQSRLFKILMLGKAAYDAHEAFTMTDEELQESMAEAMKYEDKKHTVCSGSNAYAVRLRRITSGMREVDGVPLNFKVYYDTKTANAFASPDGSVRVYSKLMDLMTDDELLGIIGHELGHVAGRHSLKEYKEALYTRAVREGLMATDKYGFAAATLAGALTETLINAKYSRMQESEADDYGYDFLVESGKNPYAIARALEKLQKLEGNGGGTYSRYVRTLFSSHPDINKRVKKLSERAEDDGYK